MSAGQAYVVAGGGLAGAAAAAELRNQGFDGRIVLVGEEREQPYERPALSKEYLRGEAGRGKLLVHPDALYGEQGIELVLGERVGAVDRANSHVVLEGDDGRRLPFDRLLLATGARPRRLDVPGSRLPGIHYLRTVGDSDALGAALRAAGRVVVVGAGWIGAEVAASARGLGTDVVLVERAPVPLERVLGPEVGRIYAEIHRDNGVELVTDARVEGFEGAGAVERVRLADGRTLDCDLAVVGIGAIPNTEAAGLAGLELDGGIAVDAGLRSSDPRVFAAGDVASAWHPLYSRRIRVEHWANARHQGVAAAHAMLGMDEPYDRVPYFFSDQYDVGMECSGVPSATARVVFRGDVDGREFIAFWIEDDRVVAGMNVNVWDVTAPIQDLVRSGAPVEAAQLEDEEVALADLAAGVVPRS